jgi:hypothetical protein
MRPKTFETVCSFDEAIDTTKIAADDLLDFMRERDISKIAHAFRAGEHPTTFLIREIPHSLFDSYVDDAAGDHERFRRAFRVGVEAVKNVYQDDGTRVEHWQGSDKQAVAGGAMITVMSAEDTARFSLAERLEIGSVAYFHSFLPRRKQHCFQVPLTSLSILRTADYLPAVLNPNAPE